MLELESKRHKMAHMPIPIYKIITKVVEIGGGSVIVSCVTNALTNDGECKAQVKRARDRLQEILTVNPSIKKDIEGL
jgi:hypothetical protein